MNNALLNNRRKGETSDSPALQRAIDQTVAVGGGVVTIPAGQTATLDYPIHLYGHAITLRGEGPSSILHCVKGSPALAVSMPTRTMPPEARPLVPAGVYDSSVSGPHYAVTARTAVPAISGHPFQLGCRGANNGPADNWAGPAPICLDFFIQRPQGAAWPDGSPLFGLATFADVPTPNPWLFAKVPGGFALDVATTAGRRRIFGACPDSMTVIKGAVQWNPATGEADFFLWGRAVATTGPEPGLALVPTDGYSPFMIGQAKMNANFVEAQINPVVVYGLRASRGMLYQHFNPIQTWQTNAPFAVNDNLAFFGPRPDTVPDAVRVAWLPLTDQAPGLATVRADSPGFESQMWWCPAVDVGIPFDQRIADAIAIQDLTILGGLQPCIQVGRVLDLRIRDVWATGASQAVGNFSAGNSYPIDLHGCTLDGWDSAVVSIDQIASIRRTQVAFAGTDAFRFHGAFGALDAMVWRVSPQTQRIVKARGADDGFSLTIESLLLDNEALAGPPTVAVIEVTQNGIQPGRLTIDRLSVATVPKGAALISLIGQGLPCPYLIEAKELQAPSLDGVPLQVAGTGWTGAVDGSLLPHGSTKGDLTGIHFTPAGK